MVKIHYLYAVEVKTNGRWTRYVNHLMSAAFAARMLTLLTIDRNMQARRVTAACMYVPGCKNH